MKTMNGNSENWRVFACNSTRKGARATAALALIFAISAHGADSAAKNASGIPLPTGEYISPITGRHYEPVYADDFSDDPFTRPDWDETQNHLDDAAKRRELLGAQYNIWGRHDGRPSKSYPETSWWRASNITNGNSCLRLGTSWVADANIAGKWPGPAGRLTGSGLSAEKFRRSIKYGRWSMVFRMDPSNEVKFSIDLYGSKAPWPKFVEIDIAEGNANSFFTTLHYSTNARQHVQRRLIAEVRPTTGSFTSWHNLSVDFSPHRLDYFLDGKRFISAVGASSTGAKPSGNCADLVKKGQLADNICYVADEAIPDALSYRGSDLGPRQFIVAMQTNKPATAATPAPALYIDWIAMYRMKP